MPGFAQARGRHVDYGCLSGTPEPPPGALPLCRRGFPTRLRVTAEALIFPEVRVYLVEAVPELIESGGVQG